MVDGRYFNPRFFPRELLKVPAGIWSWRTVSEFRWLSAADTSGTQQGTKLYGDLQPRPGRFQALPGGNQLVQMVAPAKWTYLAQKPELAKRRPASAGQVESISLTTIMSCSRVRLNSAATGMWRKFQVLPQLGTVPMRLPDSIHTEHNSHPEGLNAMLPQDFPRGAGDWFWILMLGK
jgi:hypothetical protein